jgi:DNA-binding CsgD family transcriptional regulator
MSKDWNLTNEEIRQLLKDGNPCAEIAQVFGIAPNRVAAIKGNMTRIKKPQPQGLPLG